MDSKKNDNFDMGHLSTEKVQHGEAIDISQLPPLLQNLAVEEREALEKRLVRSLDIRLMPMLVLIYILNYLDRFVLMFPQFFLLLILEIPLSEMQLRQLS